MPRTGVLLVGFGGPDSMEAVGPFMCNLMGREPSDELVTRVCSHYLAIGGKSPLLEIAESMAHGIMEALGRLGHDVPVAVGMRYWEPFIGEAVSGLAAAGCERIVTISLSPFESKVAHGAYREALAEAALANDGIEIVEAPLVSELDEYAEYFAMSAASALGDLQPNEGALLVFTAHSLPESDLDANDPYTAGLQRVATDIASRLGLEPGVPGAGAVLGSGVGAFGSMLPPRHWLLAYQSQGQRPGAWLGPSLDEVIRAASADAGVHALAVVPIGFMTDHMETLYDLDIVAAGEVLKADLEFVRAAVPNDDERLLESMAEAVAELL